MPKKKVLMAVLALIFAVMQILPAFANELEDKQAEYDDVQQKMQQMEIAKERARREAEAASDRMEEIVAELNRLQAEIKEIEAKRDKLQPLIDENQEVLTEKKAKMEGRMKIYRQRLRDIYINGQINYLDVLLGAKDFSDFLTRMDLIKRILRYDYDLITKIHQERNSIIQTKAELEKEKTATEKLYDETKTKKFALDDKKSALDKMIDRIKYDKETSEKAYKELMNASEQIALMIQRRGASAYVGTGQMIWPLGGPITSEYGWRTHPIYGNARYHSGIDIGGDYGMNIYAADSGTVTYSGWISGYGNTVIIDHGNGVSTLYGHNQSLTVSVGQNISQGDVIAHCGSTGNSTGPHCHFEVRVNGEPTNPYDYL